MFLFLSCFLNGMQTKTEGRNDGILGHRQGWQDSELVINLVISHFLLYRSILILDD